MKSKNWLDEAQHKDFIEKTRQEVLAAMKKAEQVDICDIDDLVNDVYDTPPWHLQVQLSQLKQHISQYPEAYPKTSGRIRHD